MAQQNNIAQQLNDLLVTRNFHPDMLDAQGKVCDSEDAKTFTFDYISGAGKNYGTMVVILDSDNDLKAFYGDNLGRTMEGNDKEEFFDFQQHLSQFANAHRWTYTAKDLGQLKHTMQGLAAIKEGLFEGYYGTRRISYAGEPTEARLMIRHNRNLGETDARFRYVESIFVETADGERYRLPFVNLAGGRAMLEHVRQGGKPYDVRGNHICEMITELKVLTRFNRASQGRVVEGVKQSVVQGAQTYYKSLRENIKRMASPRGYAAYFESWHPADITEQDQLVEDIKTLFVEQTIDDRIEQALPLLAKIQRGREMKEADIFENWVNSVTESHWNLPETPEQLNKLKTLMSGELIVGPDGTNAKEQLRDIIGDDDLFNRIEDLAAQDPDANLWDDTEVQDILQALGIQMPDDSAPDMNAQPEQGVAEAAKWRDPKYQGKTFDYDDSYEGPHDTKTSKISLDRAGMRQINTFDPLEYKAREKQATGRLTPQDVKYATAKNFKKEKQQQLDYDRSRKAEQGMAEADNISTFESLRRMASLAGVPLKESRIEESSEFMYEKIGKTLAQKQPMLDVDSDQFVQAVYPEMIALGMTPKSAMNLINDRDFLGDVANSFYHYAQHGELDENLGGIVGEAMVDEAQPQSEIMRRNPKGFPVTPTPLASSDARRVGALDLTKQQTEPDPLDAMKTAAGLATIAPRTVKAVDLIKNPELAIGEPQWDYKDSQPAAATPFGMSALNQMTQDQRARIMRMAAQDQMTQDQRDRITHMQQQMPDTMPGKTTSPSVSYTADGIPRIEISGGLEEAGVQVRKIRSPNIVTTQEIPSSKIIGQPFNDEPLPHTELNSRPMPQGPDISLPYTEIKPRPVTGLEVINPSTVKGIDLTQGDNEQELEECNYTPLNEYCQIHGLKECWLEEMNLSILATGSQLLEDLDEGLLGSLANVATKYGPKIAAPVSAALAGIGLGSVIDKSLPSDNSFSDSVRASINNVDKIKGTGSTQGSSFKDPFDGPFARPVDEGGMPGMGAALRGAGEMGSKAANAVKSLFKAEPEVSALRGPPPPRAIKYPEEHPDFPLLQAARDREQGNMKVWNKRYPEIPWAPQSDEDLLKSFNHDLNVQKGFSQNSRDAMPNDWSPTGYTRAQKSKGAAFDAEKSMQGNQDLFKNAYGIDEADMMNPEIPKDFGSPEHLAHLAGLGKALQSGDRSALSKSNAALAAAQIGQGKTPWEPAPTPSFSTPGAAHAGQGGYDYQDEEPKGRAHSGQGGYNYYDYDDADQSSAETARLSRLRNPNVDPALAHMLINPNNPDAFAMQRDDEPDQSDAETARLGRAGASADSEFVHAPGEAGRSINYESREGDALLARIKSLALLR